jgi:hypothetical protein
VCAWGNNKRLFAIFRKIILVKKSVGGMCCLGKVLMLPNRILIHAGGNKYILFTTSYVNRIYEGRPVVCVKLCPERPIQGTLTTERSECAVNTFIERDSSRHGAIIYPCSIKRTELRTHDRIYVYKITKPLLTLHSVYYYVSKDFDTEMRRHSILLPGSPLTVVREQQKIPGHVLKRYIDSLVSAKEACPVTLEEFSLGNITVTGCGHAFQKGSLDSVSVCPMCRVNLVKEEFVCV